MNIPKENRQNIFKDMRVEINQANQKADEIYSLWPKGKSTVADIHALFMTFTDFIENVDKWADLTDLPDFDIFNPVYKQKHIYFRDKNRTLGKKMNSELGTVHKKMGHFLT